MDKLLRQYAHSVAERSRNGRERRLRDMVPLDQAEVCVDQRRMINFASNDYLGLSQHPELKRRAAEFIEKYGVGATASRLMCGNLDIYSTIEEKLACFKGTEAALILPTGFQTNTSVFAALSGEQPLIAMDRLSHYSLIAGAQLSGGRFFRFRHNDSSNLEKRLEASDFQKYKHCWIVTESVFSMDGDVAPIAEIAKIARRHEAHIYIDEAHATGVFGKGGAGLCGPEYGATIVMGTFGKGLGSFGAYVACSRTIKDYLVNFCGGLIYSTGLPPSVLGSIDAALDIVPAMESERQALQERSELLRRRLHKLGFETGPSTTQIIPIIVGEDITACDLAQHLEDHNIIAPAIRPPTVPEGNARIRISLSVLHTKEHIDHLIKVISCWMPPHANN